jgi:hypothetical protein
MVGWFAESDDTIARLQVCSTNTSLARIGASLLAILVLCRTKSDTAMLFLGRRWNFRLADQN